MKISKILTIMTAAVLLLTTAACSNNPAKSDVTASPSQPAGQMYLYGEQHGQAVILDKEFELWQAGYNDKNMRHLFIELPYYTAEFLNMWMTSDNDDILEQLYSDWENTLEQNPDVKAFYIKIKSECPETIFHGTDVGHMYFSTGERYLKQLEEKNLKDSAQYQRAKDIMEQGKYYVEHKDDVYRENKMAENFIREYDSISGEIIMGIYGAAHTGLEAMDQQTKSVPCMANQLKQHYGEVVHSEDLTYLLKISEPSRVDTINVGGKDYQASYFGKYDLSGFKDFACREFWRLENAYDDFKDSPKTGDALPYGNYPIPVETGQVFVIDYTMKDGTVKRVYHRSDGASWNGLTSTEGFTVG